jgi:hypothetical protein
MHIRDRHQRAGIRSFAISNHNDAPINSFTSNGIKKRGKFYKQMSRKMQRLEGSDRINYLLIALLEPVTGECVVENGRLCERRPFYMAYSNIQALALLDESKGSNWLN